MQDLLKNRVAVVTGSGGGIGRAEALAMAARGAKIVVNDIGTSVDGKTTSHEPADKVVNEIIQSGGQAVANYDSVATEDGAERIIQCALDEFGRIDILINNAGITSQQMIFDISTQIWDAIIKTSLYGTFYCMRKACSVMKDQGYGRILNTSSHVGLGLSGFGSYSAAKEGVVGLSRTVARDMAQFGVTCNVIRPIAAWRGNPNADPRIDVNRPEDVAALAAYLVSEAAGDINGCIFEVWRGHVGLFMDPPCITQVLQKEGAWTTEELAIEVPHKLTHEVAGKELPFTLPHKPV